MIRSALFGRRKICALAVAIIGGVTAGAQITPDDPSLRLWLKADDLVGTNVPVWKDVSRYRTIFAVPPLPPGDKGCDKVNHTPLLTTNEVNGRVFKAVHFRQVNDPIKPDRKTGHVADRLWQTTNLDGRDPTAIGTNDFMLFIVCKSELIDGLGEHQTVVSKRGPGGCPYAFDIYRKPPDRYHVFLNYTGESVYPSGLNNLPTEWGILEVSLTANGNLVFNEYYESLGGWRESEQPDVGRVRNRTGTPFTLAFHTQGVGRTGANPWGNGAYERFAGSIAEVILYERKLTPSHTRDIENYLLRKYFGVFRR